MERPQLLIQIIGAPQSLLLCEVGCVSFNYAKTATETERLAANPFL
jgi:hypothetical protein